jgi:hypothetical protein
MSAQTSMIGKHACAASWVTHYDPISDTASHRLCMRTSSKYAQGSAVAWRSVGSVRADTPRPDLAINEASRRSGGSSTRVEPRI